MGTETKIVVKAFVCNQDGKVLLLKRSKTAPRRALEWDLPGGIADTNNFFNEIEREIKEETGLDVQDIKLQYARSEYNQGFNVVFLCFTCVTLQDEVRLSYEHDTFQWVLPEDVPDIDPSNNHKLAARYIFSISS